MPPRGTNSHHIHQVPGRNPEVGGKAKKGDAELVFVPFYEAFLGILPIYILLVTAKSLPTCKKVAFFFEAKQIAIQIK